MRYFTTNAATPVVYKVLRLLRSLIVEAKSCITAAGKNQNARASGPVFGRQIHLNLRTRYLPYKSTVCAVLFVRTGLRIRNRSVAVKRKTLHLRRKGIAHIEGRVRSLLRWRGRCTLLATHADRNQTSDAQKQDCSQKFHFVSLLPFGKKMLSATQPGTKTSRLRVTIRTKTNPPLPLRSPDDLQNLFCKIIAAIPLANLVITATAKLLSGANNNSVDAPGSRPVCINRRSPQAALPTNIPMP